MSAILVPVDGSVHSLKALRIAGDLADKYGGRVVLLHVLVPRRKTSRILGLPIAPKLPLDVVAMLRGDGADAPPDPVPEDILEAVGRTVLHDAEERIARRGLDLEVMPVERGDPVECILIAARHAGAHTIVMGCRGLSDLDSTGFGSVSQQVFQRADCTCISVK